MKLGGDNSIQNIEEKFKGDDYDEDGELVLGMKEINQRRKELKMTEDE